MNDYNYRDEPIIPQNLPIILLISSPEPSQLVLKTKPINLNNNFTLNFNRKMLLLGSMHNEREHN